MTAFKYLLNKYAGVRASGVGVASSIVIGAILGNYFSKRSEYFENKCKGITDVEKRYSCVISSLKKDLQELNQLKNKCGNDKKCRKIADKRIMQLNEFLKHYENKLNKYRNRSVSKKIREI